ncbi:MAG: protein kinase [Ignavibacteriae bacterium]|nr:protein kinase [Ignavibacteriota bacterium]
MTFDRGANFSIKRLFMVGKVISHYKILEKLGEGGMGVVYKAQDTKLDRLVALKFLPPHFGTDEEEKQRFIHEAKAASALDHPNICTIHEVNETDEGQMFIAMAYYEGETLKKKISQGAVKPKEALDIAVQVAQGLSKAHNRGIVHRDMKPANIIITEDGVTKIVDFGLAKLAGQTRITKTGTTVGTAAYMSPEQAAGEAVDHRTDIWSLGVILYEMLTGKLPFKADHEAALMYLIVNEEPPSPSALDRRIAHQVDSVVMKILQKDRTLRYQSMKEVLKALQEARIRMEAAEQTGKTKTIAVLPFENISPEKEDDYFIDGLTEELIVNLSKLKEIQVISRTTSMQYKGTKKDTKTIGGELGTRYILEGSVRKFQDNLRITAQLIDVETDAHLWAETYKGKLADVFDIQEQVSRQIVEALMVKLTPTENVVLTKRSTLNPEAYDCYLRARNFQDQSTKKSFQFAIQLFQKAIELDPRYADAYASLGQTFALMYERFDRNTSWLDKAIDASLKAIMYDASLSDAYASLGLAYFNKKMIDEALTAVRKAIELDPNNFNGYWILGRIYHITDRDREAIDYLTKALTLNPDFHTVYGDLILIYERLGNIAKHNEMLEKALAFYPRYLSQHPDDARAAIYYAIGLARAKRNEEAKQQAARAIELSPDDPLMMYNTACFYAQLGEKAVAIDTLKGAVRAGFEYYEWIKRDPDLNSIRNEPEYIELMKKSNYL